MSRAVELLIGADSDLQEIFGRYEDLREGLGVEFVASVEAYLVRISEFPEIAPIFLGRVRRQVMHRLPYGIYYEPYPTRVVVLAFLDLRQDEQSILRRLRS